MHEHPIIFSAPMVRAILEGRKTQTRRVIKPQPTITPEMDSAAGVAEFYDADERVGSIRCPYGAAGQRLWVRETWGCKDADRPGVEGGRKPQPGDAIQYAANDADAWQWRVPGALPWRTSIHMPRWASRITLELTDVRVQRVQSISLGDIEAEGYPGRSEPPDGPYLKWFTELWDGINAKRGFGWSANPYVWALTFRRVEQSQ